MAGNRVRRPKLTTKEELVEYLSNNSNNELPFSEAVWKVAVEKTQDKERQFKEISTTDYDGNTKNKKIPNGAVNPVSKYFQLLALPNFKNLAMSGAASFEEKAEIEDEEYNINRALEELEDTDEDSFIKELISIYFSSVTNENLDFVIDRLSDYYTNYEFNEGSDKFLVVSAVSDELTLRGLYARRAQGADNEDRVKKVREGHLKTLDSLRVLKKQGGKMDEGKNKFTAFLDDLEKSGELKFEIEEYPPDQIDELIKDTRRSFMRAFGDG